MRILLLIPPQPRSMPGPWFLREERHAAVDNTPTPPHMAPSVLAMVRQKLPQAECKVIDAMAERWDGDRIRTEVDAYKPDLIIGLACANHLADPDERLCIELPYPTIALIAPVGDDVAEAVLMYDLKAMCYVATDETEVTVAGAAVEFAETGQIRNTLGLVLREGTTCRHTGIAPFSDMRTYPLPAFELFPFDKYNALQDAVTVRRPDYKDTALLNGMKGCPFKCNFCIVGGDLTSARTKSGEQIFAEAKVLYEKFGRRRFNFLDSEFAANKKTAKDFCRLVIASGMKISFDVKNRIEFWDEELLALMKQAGCRAVFYGIETADPRLQAALRKNLDVEKARVAIEKTRKAGIQVYLYMMVGILGETRESLRLNAKFVAETKPDGIAWGILFPEVGSPLYQELRDTGRLVEKDWAKYRQFSGLTFKHDVYNDMDEIKMASLWMRNEYRRQLALDSTLPPRTRLAYLTRYGIGVINYTTWQTTASVPWLKSAKNRWGVKIDEALFKVSGKRIL